MKKFGSEKSSVVKNFGSEMHGSEILVGEKFDSEIHHTFRDMLADSGLDKDSEEVQAYKYAFREFRTWTAGMNYYRCALTKASAEFWADEAIQQKMRSIKVRTLQIYGTGDKYMTLAGAEGSAKYVEDHRLELLEGVSHWVQQEAPEQVNKLIEKFIKE